MADQEQDDYILGLFDPPEGGEQVAAEAPEQQQQEQDPGAMPGTQTAPDDGGPVSLLEAIPDVLKAAGVGVAKSLFETKDFVAGEPTEDEKWEVRKDIEQAGDRLASESVVNAAVIPITQFVTGLIGAGKIVKGAQIVTGAGRAVSRSMQFKLAAESAKAAATGAVVFDPHEERLSNVIQSFPSLQNPVTEYLAADPSDSAAEGRFKTALESLGMDALLVPAFKGAVAGYRYLRAGNVKAAEQAFAEAEVAAAKAQAQEVVAAEGSTRDWLRVGDVLDDNLKAVSSVSEAAARQGVTPPPPRPTLKALTDEEVTKLYKGWENDHLNLMHFHGRDRAIAAGHKFGKADLPWQMWEGNVTDDLNAFIARVAEVREKEFTKTKGGAVQTDAEVNNLVRQRVELWGEDPDIVLGVLRAAGKDATKLRINAETATALGVKAMDEAHQVVLKMRMGNLREWGGDRSKAMAEFSKRAAVASALMSYSRSMFTNAGRTLRSARGDVPRLSAEDLRKLDDLNPEALAKLFEQSGGDIGALKNILSRPGVLGQIVDAGNYLLVNNLLWGWTTHAVNLAGTAYQMTARPAQRYIGSTFQQAAGRITAREGTAARTQAYRQYRYMVGSLITSARQAGKAFVEGESIITPFKTEWFRYASENRGNNRIAFRPIQSVEDLAANAMMASKVVIGLPTRGLGFVDELTRQMSYRGMVMAEASIEADRMGLTGASHKAYVKQAVDASFDDLGAGTNARAAQEAKTVNFQQDLNRKGWGEFATMGHLAQEVVGSNPLLRQILPFVRTPVNVLREGVKLTPGLNMLQQEFNYAIRGKFGDEAQAQAIGQMSMGMLFLGTAAALVDAGMFTGSGPSDPKARTALTATGWKPNSIVWVDDKGQTNYFQIGRLDPIGLVFGTVADIMDMAQHPEKREVADNAILALGVALTHQLRERTYVQNFIQFLDAMSDPGDHFPRFAGRQVANLVPMSSAFRNYGGQSMDYMHEARTFLDHAMATVPGLASGVPLKYDAFGNPIRIRRGPWQTINDHIVDEEVLRMGLVTGDAGVSPPSPSLVAGLDMRDITLEDGRNAYEVYQQYAGHPKGAEPLKEAVAKLIQSKAYQDSPDGYSETRGTRQWMLRGIMGKYREHAKNRLRAESAVFREALVKADREARAKRAKATTPTESRVQQQQTQEQTRQLLESFGISGTIPDGTR